MSEKCYIEKCYMKGKDSRCELTEGPESCGSWVKTPLKGKSEPGANVQIDRLVMPDLSECKNCGEKVEMVIVTSRVDYWAADNEQVEEMGDEYKELIEDWVEARRTCVVGWHLCPKCKEPADEDPWIENTQA